MEALLWAECPTLLVWLGVGLSEPKHRSIQMMKNEIQLLRYNAELASQTYCLPLLVRRSLAFLTLRGSLQHGVWLQASRGHVDHGGAVLRCLETDAHCAHPARIAMRWKKWKWEGFCPFSPTSCPCACALQAALSPISALYCRSPG